MVASGFGHADLVEVLLKHGASKSPKLKSDGKTALDLARWRHSGNQRLLDLLGEDQPPALKVIPGHKVKELYDAAASYDMMAEVLSLLQEGADPNGYKDPSGNTALIKASMNGDARGSTVELLLKHGANVEAKDAVSKEWEEWTLSWIQTTLGFLLGFLIVTYIPPLSCWFHPRSFFYPFHCSVVALLFLVRA